MQYVFLRKIPSRFLLVCLTGWLFAAGPEIFADDSQWGPYTGPSRSDVDATTLDGKVLCGYQGWFNTPCDSESFGFGHWGEGLESGHGRFTVDMWPDVSDYDTNDLCAVPGLRMPDGSLARQPAVVEGTASSLGPALAESAIRALLQCQPFTMLKPEHYDQWKDLQLGFNPHEMLGG